MEREELNDLDTDLQVRELGSLSFPELLMRIYGGEFRLDILLGI